jgi:integrase
MARRDGQRKRLATGIYADRYGISAVVTVGPLRDEGRFPHGTPLDTIEAWRLERRAAFLKQRGRAEKGTLSGDMQTFLGTVPEGGRTREDYERFFRQWRDSPLGAVPRHAITETDIRTQLAAWAPSYAPGTRRHLLRVLRTLYRRLDGAGAANPTAGITIPQPKRAPRAVPVALVEQLLAHLPDRGRPVKGEPRSTVSETKIRLRVMAWTGLPQMQLERLRETDVRFTAGLLRYPGRHKGQGVAGGTWVSLLPPAVEALRNYAAAGLWGKRFSRKSMSQTWKRTIARTRRAIVARVQESGDVTELETFDAAIPDGCRPYDLRHSFLTEALRTSGDLIAVAELAQHASITTTRQYVAGAAAERAHAAVAAMAARWTPTPPPVPAPRLVKGHGR